MIHCANRLQTALQTVVCTVLVAALAWPVGALAANSHKAPVRGAKSAAVKVSDRKKATLVKTPASAKSMAKGAKGVRAAGSKTASLGKKRSEMAVLDRNARKTAQSLNKGKLSKTARLRHQEKSTRVARSTPARSKLSLVAHSRPVASVVHVMPEPRLSAGERLGLRGSGDSLDLNSSVALVVDQETSEVLFSKNDTAVLPIASLTKLMTGLVIADASLPMGELITITEEDAEVYRNSRLAVGTTLSRGELMHLALMSSENRAANALGRTYPGGAEQFVRRMNAKARELGMRDTRYVEPTGLSSLNQSSARDLATLVSVAYERQILRDLSTSPSHQLELGHRTLQYNNSNRLVRNPEWEIGLQKTGYISEAGRCLVMQAKVAGRKLIMVFLDSAGKLSRVQDAERVRRWVEAQSYQQLFVRPQG